MQNAQICTVLSMIVGIEQSWWVQELWLGTGWCTQAWVCPLAAPRDGYCSSLLSITSALVGEMKTRPECLCPRPTSPHLAACLGWGVPVMIRPVARKNLNSQSLHSLPFWHERTGGQLRGCGKRLVGLGEGSRGLSNKEV